MVYGLAGRLDVPGGVKGPPSSRGSRGGSFRGSLPLLDCQISNWIYGYMGITL